MTQNSAQTYGPSFKVSELDHSRPRDIVVTPTPEAVEALRGELGLDGLAKVRLTGKLAPLGKRDWRFEGVIGATLVQPCVVTLEPVTTRVDADVEVTWVGGLRPSDAEESEAPDDVNQEPLGAEIDMGRVLSEALAINVPDYPRADGAEMENAQFTEPGKAAMTDDDAKPFAGLAALKAQMEGKDGE